MKKKWCIKKSFSMKRMLFFFLGVIVTHRYVDALTLCLWLWSVASKLYKYKMELFMYKITINYKHLYDKWSLQLLFLCVRLMEAHHTTWDLIYRSPIHIYKLTYTPQLLSFSYVNRQNFNYEVRIRKWWATNRMG